MLGDTEISSRYQRNAAYWTKIVRDGLDTFQTDLTDPALLDLIGHCTGLNVLDAGCGEGYLSRELIKRGCSQVYGVDTCEELVAAARSHPDSGGARATYYHADVAQIPLPDASVDLVVVNRLPNGIADPSRRFTEFRRVLNEQGKMIVMSMHPCFYAVRTDRGNIESNTSIDDYFGIRTVEQYFQVAGRKSPVESFQQFFSLEEYLGMITSAGFAITTLREPRPTAQQRALDDFWNQNFTRPLFMLIECVPLNAVFRGQTTKDARPSPTATS